MSGTRDPGFALAQALLLACVVMMFAGLTVQRSVRTAHDAVHARAELQAFHAAEGGLAHGRHALRGDPGFAGADFRIGGCAVTVTVRRAAKDQWEITAVASAWPSGHNGLPVRVGLVEGFGARCWYRRSGR